MGAARRSDASPSADSAQHLLDLHKQLKQAVGQLDAKPKLKGDLGGTFGATVKLLSAQSSKRFDGWKRHLVSQHEEMKLVKTRYGDNSPAYQFLHALHSLPVQIVSMLLLGVDTVIIITELFLELSYPNCWSVQHEGISCCPEDSHVFKTSASCGPGLQPYKGEVACVPHDGVKVVHAALFWTSVTIGFIFLTELLALFSILQLNFLRNPFYVGDFIIVLTALTLELWLHAHHSNGQAALSGLLMLARTWRFVRIGHAIFAMRQKKKDVEKGQDEPTKEAVKDSLLRLLDDLEQHAGRIAKGGAQCPPAGADSSMASDADAPMI